MNTPRLSSSPLRVKRAAAFAFALMLTAMTSSAVWAEGELHSPFHIPAAPKGQKKAGLSPERCPAPPKPLLTLATNSMYYQNDPTHSHKDPEATKRYEKAIAPAREYAKGVTKLANKYVRSGAKDTVFAECTLEWLYQWAKPGAFTDLRTPQAVFNLGQLLAGFSMAYLEIRDNPYLDTAKKQVVTAWLKTLAGIIRTNVMADDADGKNSARANHRYWSGYGVGVTGVAANDADLFRWGIESARIGISEVQPDGSLPREMRRASRSRDYHVFSVAPLVMMAELGAANGLDLYSERDGAIHKLVARILKSNKDASFFEKATGVKQEPYPDGDDGIPSSRLGWLEPYHARFPNALTTQILKDKRPVMATALGGNTTLIYTGKNE